MYLLEHDETPATRAECNCAVEVFRLQGGAALEWYAALRGEGSWALMGAFALRVFVPVGMPAMLLVRALVPVWMSNLKRYRISALMRGSGFVQFNGEDNQQIPSDTEWTLLQEYAL